MASSLVLKLLLSPKSLRSLLRPAPTALLPVAVLTPSRFCTTKSSPDAHGQSSFQVSPSSEFPSSFALVTHESLIIREDMPGVGKEDVEVLVKPNQLILKGQRKVAEEEMAHIGGDIWVYNAIHWIPEEDYNLDQVKAVMKNGVLNVVVPKGMKDRKED